MKKNNKKIPVFILLMVMMFISLPGVTEQLQMADSLKGYLNYAAENNPGLQSAFNLWKAELEKVAQVRSLPDPTLNFAYFVREVETKVGPQQMKVGLMQKFPWFGKLKLRGDIFFERARALEDNFERLKLELFYKVKKLYYDYYYTSRSIVIIKENIALLKAASEQIRTMYSTGRTSYSNLIRVQIELDKLKDRNISLEDKLPTIRVALNSVMNRSLEKEIFVDKRIGDMRFHIKGSSLVKILKTTSPELKSLDHFTLSRAAGVKLARKNFLPDFSIGADIIVTGDSSVPGVTDSGKDPFLIKMSMNIPLRFKKINASIRDARMRLDAVKYKKIEKENKLLSSLETALFNFNDSGRIIKLYRDSLKPKAQQAFEVTKTAFTTGKMGFLDFIDTQRTLLDFDLVLEKAKSSHLQNLALIEKIIGKNLDYLKRERLISREMK